MDDPSLPPRRVLLCHTRAAAERLDSTAALLSAVRRLRARLPGDDRFGDPLSVAGDTPLQVLAREVNALEPDRPSVVHELGLSALQVWQALSERSGRGQGEREVTLLFTDLVGFSSWALRAGDAAAVELLRAVGVTLEAAVRAHDGRIVKRLGDGLMASFAHPQQAVAAALDAHAGLAGIEVAGHRPQMRAGAHHGAPRCLGGDYFGVDVNVAARLAESAGPGRLLVSEPTSFLLDQSELTLGRPRRLRADGAPRELRMREVSRA